MKSVNADPDHGRDLIVSRLSSLLSALGAEALTDRPGYRPADMPGPEQGLLAGLDDAKLASGILSRRQPIASWQIGSCGRPPLYVC